MNRERVRVLVQQLRELLDEVDQELDVPDEAPPASRRKAGRGSLLVLETLAPVDECARARARRAVREIRRAPLDEVGAQGFVLAVVRLGGLQEETDGICEWNGYAHRRKRDPHIRHHVKVRSAQGSEIVTDLCVISRSIGAVGDIAPSTASNDLKNLEI